ncbi:hypothetical protein DFH07DRAFT_941300 [Mycena maculata]|uniref:BTB domain-containing protein n=1 Tax=Mycena maculata TaxID=230809 RepID=A0AAD7NB43_9AGAR|nr:hypothetical protein DFH07DRAFT_941300 [Mycena maculata]
MEDDAERSDPHRVEELWFEDGSIVIQAGNSQFRVHRGILAARSPVFQDMLSFPQPPDAELVDGCPIVRLHDSATDVTAFLKAIFEPEFFGPFPTATTFDTIVGCLRLSHKYGVDYLRRRALIHLSSAYRTKLSESDTSTYNENNPNRGALEIISWPWPEGPSYNVYAIQIAREIGALWIIPSAFYDLSGAFRRIGRGVFHGASYRGIPTSLSAHDEESFFNGHNIQSQSTATDIMAFLSDPPVIDGCPSPKECAFLRLQVISDAREMIRANPSIPLDVWIADDWEKLRDLCPTCLAALQTAHQAARQVFWDKLPEIYGLPSWEELEQMKVSAIGTNWIS